MTCVPVVLSTFLGLVLLSAANVPGETTSGFIGLEEEGTGTVTQQPGTRTPIPVAVCRGRTFSMGPSKMSWLDSIVYCYNNGLIPGSIEDKDVFDCVVKCFSESGHNGKWLWTGGSELSSHGLPRKFTWFPSKIHLNTTGGFKVTLNNPNDRCLAFDVSGSDSWLNDWNCGRIGFPLCEVRLPCSSCTVG